MANIVTLKIEDNLIKAKVAITQTTVLHYKYVAQGLLTLK